MSGILMLIALASLDQSVVSLALPEMMRDLGGDRQYAWVTTGYLWGTTLILPAGGHLSDIYGPRRIALWGLALFMLGSLVCAASPTLGFLVGARVFQGLGGGLGTAACLTVIGFLFAPRERGVAVAYQSACIGVASVLGPVTGGVITQFFSWRMIFLINLPLGLICLWLLMRHLPRLYVTHEQQVGFDRRGSAWLACLTLSVLAGVSAAAVLPWTSPVVLGCLGVALLAGWGFFRHRSDFPIFDLSLVQDPVVRGCLASRALLGGVYLGTLVYLPLYFRDLRGVSAGLTGVMFIPLTFSLVLGAQVVARVTVRFGRYRPLLIAGALLVTASVGLLAGGMYAGANLVWMTAFVALTGFGSGLVFPTHRIAMQNALPAARQGSGSSLLEFTKQVGTCIIVALLGTVLAGGAHWQREQAVLTALAVLTLGATLTIPERTLSSGVLADVKKSARVLLRRR